MYLPFFFLYLLAVASGVLGQLPTPRPLPAPRYKIAWQAPRGPDSVFNQFNETFAFVGEQVGASFEIFPYVHDLDLQAAAAGYDFFYGGPTLLYCIILTDNIEPLATLVSTIDGQPVSVLSGSIIVPSGSRMTSLSDIEDKVVAAGQFTGLTTFQAELYLLIRSNISLFTQTKAVLGYNTSAAILEAVVTGAADVGFVQTADFPSSVSLVQPEYFPDQNLPSTTAPYSSQVFAAGKNITNSVRTAVTDALLSMTREAPDVLQAANYSGWDVPQSFIDIRRLGQATGLIAGSGEACNDLATAASFVPCPKGYARVPVADLANNCPRVGFVCPPGVVCICSPCKKVVLAAFVGSLTVGDFSAVMVGVVVVLLAGLFIAVMRRRNRAEFIPWSALNVNPEDVLGQTTKGLVLKGYYKNRPVACKRAYPRMDVGKSIFDVAKTEESASDNTSLRLTGCGETVAAFFGLPTRLSRRGKSVELMKERDHPNVLSIVGASKGSDGYELVLVSEFAPRGTLQDLLDNRSIKIPSGSLMKLALDVARGLTFLHSMETKYVGTKLAASSILISESFECKLSPDISPFSIHVNTRLLLAPEVLRGGEPTTAADMYSYGMLLYHVVHRSEPFAGCDLSFVAKGICDLTSDEILRPIITEEDLPDDVKLFMYRCWEDDPSRRPAIQEAVGLLMPYSGLTMAGQLLTEASQQRVLLQQILPDHVLKALQDGRTPSSRTFDMVTVFFSDIKGFTNISSTQSSDGVMRMLDELYRKFDALCTKHQLMKVETIGDSYMLVGGLKTEQPDHAARVARFALEAVEVAHTVLVPGEAGTVKIRSGFHSGPVTSGVVGTEVPRYCLFGDTVNTASRMESTGVVDRIQMSARAAALVREQDANLANRINSRAGLVTPKGKTAMQTFWLFTDDDTSRVRTRNMHLVKRNSAGAVPDPVEMARKKSTNLDFEGLDELLAKQGSMKMPRVSEEFDDLDRPRAKSMEQIRRRSACEMV